MTLDNRNLAGLLLFLGTAQFSVGLMLAAAVDPAYSIADNTISALGVRAGDAVFNTSVVITGLLVVGASYFLHRAFRKLWLTVLILLAGIGAVGVGVFPSGVPILHSLFSLVAFLFGGLAAIASAALQRSPLRYLSVILGIIALVALPLFVTGTYFGLGIGGMERMIVLPVLAWGMTFGGYLMAPAAPGSA